MRELWTADEPVFEGKHYRLPAGLHFLPKPVAGTIPFWIGGNTGLRVCGAPRAWATAGSRCT